MSTTRVQSPASQLRVGVARADITPPVGIYHPMWGAARHHRATGVHRPLYADVIAFGHKETREPSWIQVQLDMVGLTGTDHESLRRTVAEAAQLAPHQVVVAYSHTHSGGVFDPNRLEFPGGELIEPYMASVRGRLASSTELAVASMRSATITYGLGRCVLAANRDYRDEANDFFVCGYNPDAPADDTVLVARVTADDGPLLAVLVNYACHPTTLAWENTLISPDYVGAMREEVERHSGAPCIFTLGPCGDLGPRRSHLGDPAIADSNGRQLGYAVLSTLEDMSPPGSDYVYQGPVISGATLGTWAAADFDIQHAGATQILDGGAFTVDLPQKPHPDPDVLRAELGQWLQKQQEADERGEVIAARDYGARAERVRRWLNSLSQLPPGPTLPYAYSVRRLGDAIWIALSGEPYNILQTGLRSRFPSVPLVFTVLAGAKGTGYLLPADRYGVGLYQEEPSILDRGCLEKLTEAVAAQVESLL